MMGRDEPHHEPGDEPRDVVVAAAAPQPPAPTLLPRPVAEAVSLATRSTSLAIRVGSLVSSYGLGAARFTTLSGLELARSVVEGVLSRAARDTFVRSNSDLAAADAETILERSLENLHYAVTQVVFWTSAGFRLTGLTLSAATDVSQLLLSSLDQLFGSTDSSRAVASLVTLIRREFNNPATGVSGEKVSVVDLVLALGALAYLQRACRRCPAEESRRRSCEELIWDVVVLSDGQRVDVDDDKPHDAHEPSPVVPIPGPDGGSGSGGDDEAILARLKDHIIKSLPPGTAVTISDCVSSVQTISVDVQGSQLPSLPTPPGAEIIETRGPWSAPESHRPQTPLSGRMHDASYRVVYRIQRERLRSTALRRDDDESGPVVIELFDDKPPLSPQSECLASPVDDQPCLPLGFGSPASSVDEDSPAHSHLWSGPLSPPSTGPNLSLDSEDRPFRAVSHPPAAMTTAAANAEGGVRSQRPPLRPASVSLPEVTANQKKQRLPLGGPGSRENTNKARPGPDTGKRPQAKKKADSASPSKMTEKKNGLRQVLKGSGQSVARIWTREPAPTPSRSPAKPRPHWKAPGGGKSKPAAARDAAPQANRGIAAPPRRSLPGPEADGRGEARTSYVSVHEHRRDSVVSQADAYVKHPGGALRPASPAAVRADFSPPELALRPKADVFSAPASPQRGVRASASYAPSLYSLATNDSQASLVLSSCYQKSAYNTSGALSTLRREGFVDGTFPAGHLLPNVARYMRFSSACYGSQFLRFMGISTEMPALGVWDGTHDDVRHFVHHTESEPGNILLASFVDPQGGADASGATGTGVPLVHYISLDHAAKAVVLACRGTLGFEDVMADIACEYDDLAWRGRRHKVHKGIHASARRLLYGDDGRVLFTIRAALLEFPDYGLVLCGHSLGGGVTSLLGVMLAQPNPDGPGFVIAAEPAGGPGRDGRLDGLRLPPGRRIHVYAYGPPGVMSAPLGRLTRGLVTSVVHGNDLVPHLSLGLLHDCQALALAFKRGGGGGDDDGGAAGADTRQRVWRALQAGLADRWRRAAPRAPAEADEQWMLPALRALRASLRGAKLVPPGEVFAIESRRVLRRDAFVARGGGGDESPVGRPAQRVVLKYIRDVEARFGEVRFGTGMLTDHSPAKYEDALNMLRLGVVD